MKKSVVSLVLTLTLVLGLLPAMAPHVHGEWCDQHTYTQGKYVTDSTYHYAMCDVCGHWSGLNYGMHEDSNADCICDVCQDTLHQLFEPVNLGDGTHQGVCSLCGQTVTMAHRFEEKDWDTAIHWSVCRCGAVDPEGESAAHTFDYDCYHTETDKHYPMCDGCGYYQSVGEAHSFAEGSEDCTVCQYTVHAFAWDQENWNETMHQTICGTCGATGWVDHSDGADADALCDGCGFNLACAHTDREFRYDAVSHYDSCTACGQIPTSDSKREHSFENGTYYGTADKHYPDCDSCSYYLADQGADHIDNDGDDHCDICDYDVHTHTYTRNDWYGEGGYHYPWCDHCNYYDQEKGAACADGDGDHSCDVCYDHIDALCVDADGDHTCDVCWFVMADRCVDTDNDHDCDVQTCQRYMMERCSSAMEGDWVCDTCGRNFCNHVFTNGAVPNGDGTHTANCAQCGTVTEACTVWNYDFDESGHTAICRCGYRFTSETHNWHWLARNLSGHLLYCVDCNIQKAAEEAHTTQEGSCAVCGLQVTPCDDVYVGGLGLKNGQYLDNSGNVTATKPAGGYACYRDGVLELNGYNYVGHGYRWLEYDDGEVEGAALYAATELILVLKGENSLQITRPDTAAANYNYGDGIASQRNLTIRGEGSLSVGCEDDGIDAEYGNVRMEGGTLIIHSGDHGMDCNGGITVTGGRLTVTAGDDGLNADGDITVTGGTITMDAEDNGLDSAYGSVSISGGTVDITTRDLVGIDAGKNVSISGGDITIEAGDCGIDSFGLVDISGGNLEIHGTEFAIYADQVGVRITGGNLTLTSKRGAVIETVGDLLQLPAGADPGGKELTIVTPFSAVLGADGIHLTGSPWDLTVVIAAYDQQGMLTDLQVVTDPGNVVTPTVTGGTIKAFFLNGKAAPVHISLPVQ